MAKHGRFQIKPISLEREGPVTYQISFEELQGGAFVGSVEGEHLEQFLREKLRLKQSSVEALLDELRRQGHVLISDMELGESDLGSAGLQYLSPAI
jgi:hypothetical protein